MQLSEKIILGSIEDILRNAIKILEDEEYQKNVWFRGEGPGVGSYIDTTIHLIDGCDSIFKQPACKDFLGSENYDLLKKLYDLVIEHVDLTESRINPDLLQEDELLNNPNWHDIQTLAGEVDVKLTEFVRSKANERNDKI